MRTTIAMAFCLALLAGCTSASSTTLNGYDFSAVNRVAVVDVTGPDLSKAAQNEIGDLFLKELMGHGFTPVERSQIEKVLSEQSFQKTGTTPEADAVKAGQILNTDAVMIVNVPENDNKVRMTAKMIEVKSGSILWLAEGTGSSKRGALTIAGAALGATAGAVIGHQVSHGSGAMIGGIAGGAAGGAGGYFLEPEAAAVLRKLITKMSIGMPSKMGPMPTK